MLKAIELRFFRNEGYDHFNFLESILAFLKKLDLFEKSQDIENVFLKNIHNKLSKPMEFFEQTDFGNPLLTFFNVN